MLSPHFAEGSRLGATGTVEIPLPDDDAVAMGIACDLAHLRFDRSPDTVTLDVLCEIAKMADKYDFSMVLKYPSSQWITALQTGATDEVRETLLAAAFMLHNAHAYEAVGRQILMESDEEITGAGAATFSDLYNFAVLFCEYTHL